MHNNNECDLNNNFSFSYFEKQKSNSNVSRKERINNLKKYPGNVNTGIFLNVLFDEADLF